MNYIKPSESGGVRSILSESLELLAEKPALFIPKTASTAIGAVWMVAILEDLANPYLSLASIPFLLGLGYFSSVIVAKMVETEKQGPELILIGLNKAGSEIKNILSVTLILTFLVVIISLPTLIGFFLSIARSSTIYLALGVSVTVILGFLATYYLYFIPVVVSNSESGINVFKKSKNFSRDHRKDTLALTVFSGILAAIAFASSGFLENLGYAGFIAGRLLSGVLNTYMFTLGPKYYLD